jgi:hypothetical protein
MTALYHCVNKETMKKLLRCERFTELNTKNKVIVSTIRITWTCQLNVGPMLSLFSFQFGFNINISLIDDHISQNGSTALHWAAGNGDIEIVAILLGTERFTEMNAKDKVGHCVSQIY